MQLNIKTYYVSGLFSSFLFSVCMQEIFWEAFSTKLCQLCSACSSFSQSEMDIISGRPIAAPSLETQHSINSSSDVICPWIPETIKLASNQFTMRPIKTLRKKQKIDIWRFCDYSLCVYMQRPHTMTHQAHDFAAVTSSVYRYALGLLVKQKLVSKSIFTSIKISIKTIQNCASVAPHRSLRWLACPAV